MKKKLVILGSTGSIGENTFDIINKDKKNFKVEILSANKNISKLIIQARKLKVKNLIINDHSQFIKAKKKYKRLNLNFYNSFNSIEKILKGRKIDYSMISIVGLDGLEPTLKMIKYSKNIAIANKESLICAWSLIKKNLLKYKTNFIPIDSEHFSIHSLIKNQNKKNISKIYITASGGPFLNFSKSMMKKIRISQALKHPNWKMGKKISIDSSTMMNKVFEVIEAKNIFELTYDKIDILTHPKSYVHTIVKFNDGNFKLLLHEPNMKIPIHNSIYNDKQKNFKSKILNLSILNDLSLKKIDKNNFPLVKLLKRLPKKNSLYETALITVNDFFVYKFLEKKIDYMTLIKMILKYSNDQKFIKFKKINVKTIKDIYKIRNYVSFKLESLSI